MANGLVTALVLFLSSAQAASDGGAAEEAVLMLGRTLSADFWAGRLDAVWGRMSPDMQKALGGNVSGLAAARQQILSIAGGPGELISEGVRNVSGTPVYVRTFRGPNGGQQLQEQWAIQGARAVVGFWVRPPKLFLQSTPAVFEQP